MKVSELIEDESLREIAQRFDLDEWEWGTGSPATQALMMEGCALGIHELTQTVVPFFSWQQHEDNGESAPALEFNAQLLDLGCIFSIDLGQAVRGDLEVYRDDQSYPPRLKETAGALRSLADDIDSTIAEIDATKRAEQEEQERINRYRPEWAPPVGGKIAFTSDGGARFFGTVTGYTEEGATVKMGENARTGEKIVQVVSVDSIGPDDVGGWECRPGGAESQGEPNA